MDNMTLVTELQQASCTATRVIPLSDPVKDFLKPRPEEDENPKHETEGGVFSDTRYSWLASGPRLEVLLTRSGVRMAAWVFGAAAGHEQRAHISCVADVPRSDRKPPLVVVGLNCELTGGMLCVFDVLSSRVVRAVQLDDQISSVCMVNGGGDAALPGALHSLDGVVAVGTVRGRVLLLDLCRQAVDEACAGCVPVRDESRPCRPARVPPTALHDLERLKQHSLKAGEHLCLQLEEASTAGPHFVLQGPRGEQRARAALHEVEVSALHYAPQLGALLVGFNFGAFQVLDLLAVQLRYTSGLYERCEPVTQLAVQEPSDDPRAFCYLWAVYGGVEPGQLGLPTAVMYALAFGRKEQLESYGVLYQDLASCSARFQMPLGMLPGGEVRAAHGARCLTLRTHAAGTLDDRLALCCVSWCVWDTDAADHDICLCLFDLDQWYKEQMPVAPRTGEAHAYMATVSLGRVLREAGTRAAATLDVRLQPAAVAQFSSPQRLEEHFRPSALRYRCVCVRPIDVVWLEGAGVQRHLLTALERAGPLSLLQPADVFRQCVALGLAPLCADVPAAGAPVSAQRELVLSVALEQQLVAWLCACARDWADGSRAAAGCTLDALLSWAWQRAATLKAHAHQLCAPLFDHSGLRLDANSQRLLTHYCRQLKHLCTLYGVVAERCGMRLAPEDTLEVDRQRAALHMLCVYFEVLQWLLNVGLLPECPAGMYPRPDEAERVSAPYPADALDRFYHERRAELRRLDAALSADEHDGLDSSDCSDGSDDDGELGGEPGQGGGRADTSCRLLFIDGLLRAECGGELQAEWRRDGGSGLYPPASLQALLRTYLVQGVPLQHKHCVFIYLCLDLAMALDHGRHKSIIAHLIKFPAVFQLSPSLIKITQAFWQLDHGDFSTAMAQLLDPLVESSDLRPWHHRTALRALLAQGHWQHALLYQQVRRPPTTRTRDLCTTLSLLTLNGLLHEAFHFQRRHRSVRNQRRLLRRFLHDCSRTEQLAAVLQLSLCPVEEDAFVSYLHSQPGGEAHDLLVFYYLHRSRYSEAFHLGEQLDTSRATRPQGLAGQHDAPFRDVVLTGVRQTLPAVLLDLVEHCRKHRPTTGAQPTADSAGLRPMSVFVHDADERVRYKSTLIEAGLAKARETWARPDNIHGPDEVPFLSSPRALPIEQRPATPLIYAAKVAPSAHLPDDCDQSTPSKRMKLMSRPSIGDRTRKFTCDDSQVLLDTPVVKRKSLRPRSVSRSGILPDCSVGSPASILKVGSLLRSSASPLPDRECSTTPELLDMPDLPNLPDLPDSDSDVQTPDAGLAERLGPSAWGVSRSHTKRTSPLGVSPRRPIQRTPRPAVRFDVDKSTSLSDGSVDKMDVEVQVTPKRSGNRSLLSNKLKLGQSPQEATVAETAAIVKPHTRKRTSTERDQPTTDKIPDIVITTPRRSARPRVGSSVRSRRSYKAATPKDEPNVPDTPDVPDACSEMNETPGASPETAALSKPDVFPKVGGRKSLSRQVLEQNTFSKALSSPRMQTRLSAARLTSTPDTKHTVSLETSFSETTKCTINVYKDGHTQQKTSSMSSRESKSYFSTQTDPATNEQVIKVQHNESSSKFKFNELLESDTEDREVLDSSSDLEDSFVNRFRSVPQQAVRDLRPDRAPESIDISNEQQAIEADRENVASPADLKDPADPVERQNEVNASLERRKVPAVDVCDHIDLTQDGPEPQAIDLELTDDVSTNDAIPDVMEVCVDVHVSQTESDLCELKAVPFQAHQQLQQEMGNRTSVLLDDSRVDTDDFIQVERIMEREEDAQASDQEEMGPLKLNVTCTDSEEEKVSGQDSDDDMQTNTSFEEVEEPNLGDLPSSDEDQIHEEYEEVDLGVGEDTSDEERVSGDGQDEELPGDRPESDVVEVQSSGDEENGEDGEDGENRRRRDSSSNQEVPGSEELNEPSPEYEEHTGIEAVYADDDNVLEQNVLEPDDEAGSLQNETRAAAISISTDTERPPDLTPMEDFESTTSHLDKDSCAPELEQNVHTLESSASVVSETLGGCAQDCLEQTLALQEQPNESEFCRTDILTDIEIEKYSILNRSGKDDLSDTSTEPYVPQELEQREEVTHMRSRRLSSRLSQVSGQQETESSKRAASCEPSSPRQQTKRRTVRSASLEPQETVARRSMRASSVASLPPIVDVEAPALERRGRRKSSVNTEGPVSEALSEMDRYSASHRLTRRQRLIMEKSMELQNKNRPEGGPELGTDRTIGVGEEPLDDPASPASSSGHGSRQDRPRRKSFTLAQQAISTPPKSARRTRRSSQDTDISDTASVVSVPTVVLQPLEECEVDRLTARHRSLSPKLLKKGEPEGASPAPRRNTRLSILPKIVELSQITEESVQSEPKATPKRGRPKKIKEHKDSDKEDKNPPGSSYETRSLMQHVPEYTSFRRRKSVSLKRLSRRGHHN